MDEVSALISQQLEIMIEAADTHSFHSRHKAITVLFPYAVWQERNGHHDVLDTFLRAARASGEEGFMWHRIEPFVTKLLNRETPVFLKRANILTPPHLLRQKLTNVEHPIQPSPAPAAVPLTDDVNNVADTSPRIASDDSPQHSPLSPSRQGGMSHD